MPIDDTKDGGRPEALRLRRCNDPSCNAMFTLCASCDRGQRYCGGACRARMRRQQRAAAVRRYQASPSGKEAHRRRQRAYRTRRQTSRVTHHGPILIMNSDAKDVPSLCRCRICGLESNWINPWLPHPLALRRKPKSRPPWFRRGVQISTFLHDR